MKNVKNLRRYFPLIFVGVSMIGMMICLMLHRAMGRFTSLIIPGALISALLIFMAWKIDSNRRYAVYASFLLNTGIVFQAILGEKDVGHLEILYIVAPIVGFIGVVGTIFLIIETDQFRRRYPIILLFVLNSLVNLAVLLFGNETGGVRAWIRIFGFQFQATDISKLLTIISWGFILQERAFSEKKRVILCSLLFGTDMICLVCINEYGTMLVLAVTLIVLFIVYTEKRWLPIICILILLLGMGLGIAWVDKIKTRIDIWLNPELDPYGTGYQLLQSISAIQLGGLFGDYTYGNHIPVPDSDFAFSSLVNGMGVIMGICVILVYALFFRSGADFRENKESTIGTGLLISVMITTLISLCGSIGLLPTIGLPMAFISYGGTNLACSIFTVLYIILIQSDRYESYKTNVELQIERNLSVRKIRRNA